jgi:DNA invertase Pin-like site-specific DNA recombinase
MAPPPRKVRAAVYTRKSTEEGLEQNFNSLDAQFAACAAYVESQRHEGWLLVERRYDDGGFSGGNLDRPGLKSLLKDVAEGRIDVIVVYKVDRLTRSLMDFSKIVERLEQHQTSFVSITQSFNTTTSMGRLTLHILLSFAQFEREVIAERVRDKVAASKRRGIWMGGSPPLGYDSDNGRLKVNVAAAEQVREIMRLYRTLRNGRLVLAELRMRGIRTRGSRSRAGTNFTRGPLFYLLNNRTYIGEIRHHDQWFAGVHEAIVPQDLFDEVQAIMRNNAVNDNQKASRKDLSWLSGKVFDGSGVSMRADMTTKGSRTYRYYVAKAKGTARRRLRVPAFDLEEAVVNGVRSIIADEPRIADMHSGDDLAKVEGALRSAREMELSRAVVRALVSRVVIEPSKVIVFASREALGTALGMPTLEGDEEVEICTAKVRNGKARRLVLADRSEKARPLKRNLITLLETAELAKQLVNASPGLSLEEIAAREGRCGKYLQRLYKVAHLAPTLKVAILEGKEPDSLTSRLLLQSDLAVGWRNQARALGFQ